MFQKLFDRTLALAGHRHALPSLAVVAFIESSIFPVPPHLMLAPMVLARPERAWRIAAVCTLASVLGGLFGYAIGYFLFDVAGEPIIAAYGFEEQFARFRAGYNEWGAWIVALFGATPFPYKVITIASGVTQLNLVTFTLASLASRGFTFFLIAALLKYFGPPMQAFIEKRLGLMITIVFLAVIGGVVALKYL
ncbi:MAG: DedA family protein [Alphaproteobacteria bacterium]|nr:MAG: DedA family protein [Alphaproteobacteria bacterium]